MSTIEELPENEKPPLLGDDAVAPALQELAGSPSQQLSAQAEPLPNGGLQALIQLLGGFAIFFNTWGLIATYAVSLPVGQEPSHSLA